MTQGYVSRSTGACVASPQEAASALCSGFPKASIAPDGSYSVIECSYYAYEDGSGSVEWSLSEATGTGSMVFFTGEAVLPLCEVPVSAWELSAADGALVAGAIAAVWLSAWGWRAVRSALA